MKKNKNSSSIRQSEVFDIMLSEQDYQRGLQIKNLYESTLEANKALQSELQTYKLNFLAIKKQGQQLVKKVMKLSTRIISLEEVNSKLQYEKQQIMKQKSSLLAQNKKLIESIKQLRSNKEIQNKLRKQVQKLTNQLDQQNKNYTEIQVQNNNIQALNRNLQEQNEKYKNQIESLQKEIQNMKASFDNDSTQKVKANAQNEKLAIMNQKLTVQNSKLMALNSQMQTFSQKMSDKIMKIMVLFSLNEIKNQQNTLQGSQINQNGQNKSVKGKKYIEKVSKPEEQYQSIIMDNKNSFTFIEECLNSLMDKVKQVNTLQIQIKQLKQLNKNLETGYEALNKRIKAYENRCQILEIQMSSQLNVQKVIQRKYEGIKQTFSNNEDIGRAMEELIKTYHEALDNGYAKILQKMFNQH